jgi:hypothetical protein
VCFSLVSPVARIYSSSSSSSSSSSMILRSFEFELSLPCHSRSFLSHSGLNRRRSSEQLMFYKKGLLAPCVTTILVGWVLYYTYVKICVFPVVSPYLCSLEAGWPHYTPRHWVPVLVASYDTHGVRWGYSVSRPPLEKARISSYYCKERAFVMFQCI